MITKVVNFQLNGIKTKIINYITKKALRTLSAFFVI